MAYTWTDSIPAIVNGTNVDAPTTNASLGPIVNNLKYLKSLLDAGITGAAIVASNQVLGPGVIVGTPLWYNGATQRYEAAQAVAIPDPTTTALTASPQCNVVGICIAITGTSSGSVLLAGRAVVDITGVVPASSVTGPGVVTAGRYFLSATAAGQLTPVRPPITVAVLYADGAGGVFLLPQVRDFWLGDHTHYSIPLVAQPAGDTVPPAVGGIHTVLNPNSSLAGWLPANHSVFGGLAPAGAAFGYNIAADATLSAAWPPVPLQAYSIQITKYNPQDALQQSSITVNLSFLERGPQGAQGAQGAQGRIIGSQGIQGVQVGSQGIYEGGVGTETDEIMIPYPCAVIGDTVYMAPLEDPGEDLIWDAYVRVNGYVTVRLGSTLDKQVVVPTNQWIIKLLKPASSGCGTAITHASIDPVGLVVIDNNGIWWMSNCYGDSPWPTQLNTLVVGPGVSSPTCPRPDQMSIVLSFAKLSFGNAMVLVNSLQPSAGSPIYYTDVNGNRATAGNLYAGLKLTRELSMRVVQLTAVDEQNGAGFHYWRFPQGVNATIRGEFEIPTIYVGSSPSVQFRFLLYGAVAGRLDNLVLTYRRLPRPAGSPVTPPGADTAASITTAVTVAQGQVVEVISSAVPVALGDVLLFSLSRAPGGGFLGDMGLVRAQAVLSGN